MWHSDLAHVMKQKNAIDSANYHPKRSFGLYIAYLYLYIYIYLFIYIYEVRVHVLVFARVITCTLLVATNLTAKRRDARAMFGFTLRMRTTQHR